MHKRIKELAEQARNEITKSHGHSDAYQNIVNERFAELIIKECANVAKEKQVFVGFDIGEAINKHFGVA